MKKFFVLTAVLAAVFGMALTGCDGGSNGTLTHDETTLTIINNSSRTCGYFQWNGTTISSTGDIFPPGGRVTNKVQPGNSYVYFMVGHNSSPSLMILDFLREVRTVAPMTIEDGEAATIYILDSTLVVRVDKGTTSTLIEAAYPN